jgi:site-specific recombinase XerD
LTAGWQVAPVITLTAALETFLTDCSARQLAPKTLAFYRWELGRFVGWLQRTGVVDVAGVTSPLIRDYILGLQGRGLKPTSVHCAARSVRCWFAWLETEDLLPGKNPARRVKLPKLPRAILPALSRSEVCAIIEAAGQTATPERDKAVVLTLIDSGLRASELCDLTWDNVDLRSGRVFVQAGKGDKDRYTFLGLLARHALTDYRATLARSDAGDAVFQRANNRFAGGGLHYDGLKMLLRRLGAAAGVENCHAHAFRRSFAVEMLRDGADLVRLARLMGHADLIMLTRHYLPLLTDDLADAHREHSPGDRLRP